MDDREERWVGEGRGEEGRNKKKNASIIEIGRGGVPRMKPMPGPVILILNASPRIARTRVDARVG